MPPDLSGTLIAMSAASNFEAVPAMADNGLELLLDPLDRFPLREVIVDVEQPDPLVLRGVLPPATPGGDSSCTVVVGHLGGAASQHDTNGKRKESPTQSVESTRKVNPEAPGWTRR